MSERSHFEVMTIVAQDLDMKTAAGDPLTIRVAVPKDRLSPGPRSHRFHVVDLDIGAGTANPPANLGGDDEWSFVDAFGDDKPLTREDALTNHSFHAQNVYAISARTLATFERLLGRRVPWAFPSPVLSLLPHAIDEANAFYSRDDRSVLFGYARKLHEDSELLTCLSHDIIAHEVTHAVLDGLRPRLMEPGLPDQPAFHEALADIVALLSVLSLKEAVARLLPGESEPDGRAEQIRVDKDSEKLLAQSVLFGLAEEFGKTVHRGRAQALRRSVRDIELTPLWKDIPAFTEPHRRAEVVVKAVMESFLDMWVLRLQPYIDSDRDFAIIDLGRFAEEGAKAAGHLLGMIVRSVDYLPPVELEFGDVVEAILVADEVVVPDDRYQYRPSIRENFSALGINPPAMTMSEAVTEIEAQLDYRFINLASLATSCEEVYRFIWQNMDVLGLKSAIHLTVDRVVATSRVDPYGLALNEIVADYSQVVDVKARNLSKFGIGRGSVPLDTNVQLWGSGVLVFDQFGRLRQHKAKRILGDALSQDRQTRRLKYLFEAGLSGRDGGFGASMNVSRGKRFASLHTKDEEESW